MTATPTRPTPEQLQRVLDVVNSGLDLDDAIEAVWEDVKPPAKPVVMVTEFPDGIMVAWDFCTVLNGGCGQPVSKCACKGGPREPRVFNEWRTGTKTMPQYGKATTVGTAPTSASRAKATTPVRPGPAVHPDGQVVCREHNDFVDQTEADQNDDKTWTCFACQEAEVQRGVQTDG